MRRWSLVVLLAVAGCENFDALYAGYCDAGDRCGASAGGGVAGGGVAGGGAAGGGVTGGGEAGGGAAGGGMAGGGAAGGGASGGGSGIDPDGGARLVLVFPSNVDGGLATYDFGTLELGTSPATSMPIRLRNDGTATSSEISAVDWEPFEASGCVGARLDAGSECTVTVTQPGTPGPHASTVALGAVNGGTVRFELKSNPAPYRALTVISGPNGRIGRADAGDCTGTCLSRVPQSERLVFDAWPSRFHGFARWDAGCLATETNPTCEVLPGASNVVIAGSFELANRAFISGAGSHGGQLGGTSGSFLCQALSGQGAPSDWVALVSTDAGLPALAGTGWVRMTDGLPLFNTVDDLLTGNFLHSFKLDETGAEVAPDVRVWSGVGGLNCAGFTSMTGNGGYTSAGDTGESWFVKAAQSCAGSARFICLDVGRRVTVRVRPPAQSRLAFVSTGTFRSGPDAGLAAADALCQSEARVPGTYRALLASGISTPHARMAPGPAWVRPDGVVVVPDGGFETLLTDAKTGTLEPISLNAAGQLNANKGFVMLGTPTGNCNGFTQGTPSQVIASMRETTRIYDGGNELAGTRCGDATRVFCFQQ